ncbi:MAG: hypothetical protein DME25_22115, partial [Verrucomicrobia bacterium]
MNASLMGLEISVLFLALGVLLADLWVPAERRRQLGYVAAVGTTVILLFSFLPPPFFRAFHETGGAVHLPQFAFSQSYVLDDLALFFKRFFLLAAVIVLLMAAE